MAAKYWIKLYHEILHDPKMGRLSDRLYRRCMEMFLIAGEMDEEGVLPPVDDMAWTLRTDPEELAQELHELAQVGIVACEDGQWVVTQFAARQAPVSDSERMSRYRERQRKAQYHGDTSVTTLSRGSSDAVTNRNVEADTDTDVDADAEPRATHDTPERSNGQAAATAKGPGPILGRYGVLISGPVQSEMWQELYEHAGEPLFEAAMRETAANQTGPPRLRYVDAIIKRCQEEGTMPGQWKEGNSTQPRASPGPAPLAPTRWINPLTGEEENVDDG